MFLFIFSLVHAEAACKFIFCLRLSSSFGSSSDYFLSDENTKTWAVASYTERKKVTLLNNKAYEQTADENRS